MWACNVHGLIGYQTRLLGYFLVRSFIRDVAKHAHHMKATAGVGERMQTSASEYKQPRFGRL